MNNGEYSYIGRAWCGCVVAARVDRGDKRTADFVAEMIRDGLVVERVLTKDVDGILNWDCKHSSRPPLSNFESVIDVIEGEREIPLESVFDVWMLKSRLRGERWD